MKKKKIAICTAQALFMRGGAELHVEELYKNLIQRGYDTEVVNVPFKWYPKEQLLRNIISWRLLDLSESNGEKIDLVIPMKFPSYVVKHENKVPWVLHQHRPIYDLYGTEFSDFQIDNAFDNKIRDEIIKMDNKSLMECKKIFTNAKNTAKRLKLYNNIESEHLYHPPKHVGKYKCETFGDYILSVGRLDTLKRIDLLIKALKYCDEKVTAIIAGKGPHEKELKKLVEKENLNHRVKFLGFVEDKELIDLYANAFAIYFAPYDEDYGYITLEAFLSNKPVITCNDSGGSLEFVKNGVNGFVCDPQENSIASKINWLYGHKKECKDFGYEGYMCVKDITWDYAIERLTETLR